MPTDHPADTLNRELRDMGLTPTQAGYACRISPRRMEALCRGAPLILADAQELGRLTGISPGRWMQWQYDWHIREFLYS